MFAILHRQTQNWIPPGLTLTPGAHLINNQIKALGVEMSQSEIRLMKRTERVLPVKGHRVCAALCFCLMKSKVDTPPCWLSHRTTIIIQVRCPWTHTITAVSILVSLHNLVSRTNSSSYRSTSCLAWHELAKLQLVMEQDWSRNPTVEFTLSLL